MLVARLSAPGWDQVAASAQLRCSWLCPPPAPHRTPEAEAGRGRGPASRGGGGEEEWEGEGAALTHRLPENTLSEWRLRMRASSLGSLAESGHQGGQLLALTLQKGKLRPGRYLDTPALLGIPGPHWSPLGGVGPGRVRDTGTCTSTYMVFPHPLLFPPPAEKYPPARGLVPSVLTPLGTLSLPAPAADPLLLCTGSPDPRTLGQNCSGPGTPA